MGEDDKLSQRMPDAQNAPADSSVDEYYKRLREGKRDFDPKTAEALLMQVNMESASRNKQIADPKYSLPQVLLFPWRIFDPATTKSSRRIIFVLIIIVILAAVSYLLPSFME